MSTHTKAAFGYIAAGPSFREDPTPVGIFTPVFGSPQEPFVQQIGPDGNVAGFIPISEEDLKGFVAVKKTAKAQVGSPHLLVWVGSAATAKEADVLTWSEMVGKVLTGYPAMRASLLKYPLAGFRVANFALGLAPAYASAAKPSITVDFEPFGPELDRIAADDAISFRRSPQVRWLAKELGIDVKPHRDTELLP